MTLTLTERILLFIVAVLTVGIFGVILYTQHQLAVQQTAIQTQVIATQQLADNISRASSTWATSADLQAFAAQNAINLQTVQDNLSKLNASLTAIDQTTANSSAQNNTNVPSSSSTPITTPGNTPSAPPVVISEPVSSVLCNGKQISCPNPDKFNYLSNRQELTLNEDFIAPAGATAVTVPIGSVGFSANQQQPWDLNIAPRAYNLTTTLGTKTDGSEQQVAYNQLSINVSGKDYNVPITKNQFLQQVITPKMSWFNPRLFLGADAGINITSFKGEVSPTIALQIASYGTSTITPDWSILQLGAGYDTVSRETQISVMPFGYNIGKTFKPLINNLYLGPVLDIGINGDFTAGGGVRVGL